MLYIEKYYGRGIWWGQDPNYLHLSYHENTDLSYLKAKLSDEGLIAMNRLAKELAILYKVEAKSKGNMRIYACSPNRSYLLFKGNYCNEILKWQLLTDGEVKSIITYDNEFEDCFMDSPYDNSMIKLDEQETVCVEIENASCSIMQGISNGTIKRLQVYITLIDNEYLEKVSTIANNDYQEESFVKKIGIK